MQYFEYKLSHYLGKSFESFFGFQSVLPGAFSMFTWESIKSAPLEEFFKGLDK
jgi:chitin synthase